MAGFWLTGLLAGMAVVQGGEPDVRQRASPAPVPESVWAAVIECYTNFYLPLPKPGSKLVMVGKRFNLYEPDESYLAFQQPQTVTTNRPVFLVGVEWCDTSHRLWLEEQQPTMGRELKEAPTPVWAEHPYHNAVLATAIQLRIQGETNLSARLFAYGLSVTNFSTLDRRSLYQASAAWTPCERVADLAWAYWESCLTKPDGEDWSRVVPQLEDILTQYPALVTSNRTSLLVKLKATMNAPSPSTEVERLLFQLPLNMPQMGYPRRTPGPSEIAILKRGLEVVPELVKYLDDPRLTRDRLLPLGAFVRALLRELSLGELGWQDFSAPDHVSRVLKWWERTTEKGNAAYYGAHPDKPVAAYVLAVQCSELMPSLLETACTGRVNAVWCLVDALPYSKLTQAEQGQLLTRLAHVPNLDCRRVIIAGLASVDHESFVINLVTSLHEIPSNSAAGSLFTHAVMKTEDPRVWQAFNSFLKRAEVCTRLQALTPLNYAYVGTNAFSQRLDCLAAFLERSTVPGQPVASKREEGPCKVFHFDAIYVDQFAAMQMAQLLGLPDDPDPDWKPERWDELKCRVKAELARRREAGTKPEH